MGSCTETVINLFALNFFVFSYDEQIQLVEGEIITRLRELFSSAQNANEMFRIFRRFNSLFIRANIKGAIREYQAPLIEKTKVDIQALQVS